MTLVHQITTTVVIVLSTLILYGQSLLVLGYATLVAFIVSLQTLKITKRFGPASYDPDKWTLIAIVIPLFEECFYRILPYSLTGSDLMLYVGTTAWIFSHKHEDQWTCGYALLAVILAELTKVHIAAPIFTHVLWNVATLYLGSRWARQEETNK